MNADSLTERVPSGNIAFLDSGIGGIPYLKEARDFLPGYSYLYMADTAHFPYGEKSEEQVRRAVLESAEMIAPTDPAILVIACNTASVTALEDVRRRFSFPVIGVVPAVKPAAAGSQSRGMALLATERTLQDPYLDDLIEKFAPDYSVLRQKAPELVRFVEESFLEADREERDAVLAPHVKAILASGADTLVLGCTHFLYLGEDLKRLLGRKVTVFDSLEGVRRRIGVIADRGGLAPTQERGSAFFSYTGETLDQRYRNLAEWAGLTILGES